MTTQMSIFCLEGDGLYSFTSEKWNFFQKEMQISLVNAKNVFIENKQNKMWWLFNILMKKL